MATIQELECRNRRLIKRNAELVGMLRAIKEFAQAHHGQQPENEWLYALKVDIPDMCERAMGNDVQLKERRDD